MSVYPRAHPNIRITKRDMCEYRQCQYQIILMERERITKNMRDEDGRPFARIGHATSAFKAA